jgi:hypothetical protein
MCAYAHLVLFFEPTFAREVSFPVCSEPFYRTGVCCAVCLSLIIGSPV